MKVKTFSFDIKIMKFIQLFILVIIKVSVYHVFTLDINSFWKLLWILWAYACWWFDECSLILNIRTNWSSWNRKSSPKFFYIVSFKCWQIHIKNCSTRPKKIILQFMRFSFVVSWCTSMWSKWKWKFSLGVPSTVHT